jgi:hypothetical protein
MLIVAVVVVVFKVGSATVTTSVLLDLLPVCCRSYVQLVNDMCYVLVRCMNSNVGC